MCLYMYIYNYKSVSSFLYIIITIRLSIISIIITMGYTYYSFWEHISGTLKTNWEMYCDFCLWKIVLGKMIGEIVELMHFILQEHWWKNGKTNWKIKEMRGKNMKKYHKTVARFGTFIELDYGKICRKVLYFMVKTMVSCRFSLKPI